MRYLLNGSELPLDAFDAVEIHAIDECDDHTSDECAAYWAVALHLKEGGIECVADLPSRALAEQMAEALLATLEAIGKGLDQ